MASRPATAEALARRRLAAGGVLVAAVLIVGLLAGGGGRRLAAPAPGAVARPVPGYPFNYSSARASAFAARALVGESQVLFTMSPGGALATARRVARFRPLIDAAVRGTGIDPALLEGIVFVESAGRPQVIAGSDPAGASGLTQILAQTGQSLLGMHIDLARSRTLTRRIDAAAASGRARTVARLERARARIDQRFAPPAALAATVRYLELARRDLGGREDLAAVSYHMGIGNLEHVLAEYDGGHPVPYVQLYFDTSPLERSAAWRLLSGFSDESSLYYWRVLGAERVMRLYRSDRPALRRLDSLEVAYPSDAEVLDPPSTTASFATPAALSAAYGRRTLVALPRDPATVHLAYAASMGALAQRLGAPAALYRGLRPVALATLIEIATLVQRISGAAAPLTVASTVRDTRYDRLLGVDDPPAATGYTFQIDRHYESGAQAEAFQFVLDRLQALDLIGWIREAGTIEITVAPDAGRVIAHGVGLS
jgi:Transglycosylase SLT domain